MEAKEKVLTERDREREELIAKLRAEATALVCRQAEERDRAAREREELAAKIRAEAAAEARENLAIVDKRAAEEVAGLVQILKDAVVDVQLTTNGDAWRPDWATEPQQQFKFTGGLGPSMSSTITSSWPRVEPGDPSPSEIALLPCCLVRKVETKKTASPALVSEASTKGPGLDPGDEDETETTTVVEAKAALTPTVQVISSDESVESIPTGGLGNPETIEVRPRSDISINGSNRGADSDCESRHDLRDDSVRHGRKWIQRTQLWKGYGLAALKLIGVNDQKPLYIRGNGESE